MLRINRKTDYAIRVVLAIAKEQPGARLSSEQVQQTMLIPRSYAARIVAELAQLDILRTVPGPNGGLQLARPAEEISLLDIIEGINGRLLLSDCLCEEDACPLGSGCPVRVRVARVQDLLLREFGSTTFKNLAEDARQLDSVYVVEERSVFSD